MHQAQFSEKIAYGGFSQIWSHIIHVFSRAGAAFLVKWFAGLVIYHNVMTNINRRLKV